MFFDENKPRREISTEADFSIYKAILSVSEALGINSSVFLLLSERVNRVIVSLIINLLFSSVVIISFSNNNSKLIFISLSLIFSYGLTYFVEKLSQKIYKPKFYNREKMNLVDIVNKVSGPNKNYDILDLDEYKIRQQIEFRLRNLVSTIVIVFVLAIVTSILIEYKNIFGSKLQETIFINSVLSCLLYFIVLYCFIHFAFSLKDKSIDLLIYGILLAIFVLILAYLLIHGYGIL